MATKLSIINECLSLLGYPPIPSVDDDSFGARVCKLYFDTSLNSLLESFTWSFAMKRKILELYEKPDPIYGWVYRFALPNDCLRVVTTGDYSIPYKIEGRYILTNFKSFPIVYISADINLQHCSYAFAEAASAKLSMYVSNSINSSAATMQMMSQLYNDRLSHAKRLDGCASFYTIDGSGWLDSRL